MNEALRRLSQNRICNTAYADDLAVLLRARTLSELKRKFNETIGVISTWCEKAGLSISIEKCQVMQIGKCKVSGEHFEINGKPIEDTDKLKYLGLMIDRLLNWNEHIKYIDQKANKIVDVARRLNRMSDGISLKLKRTIYMQVCLTNIGYLQQIWSGSLSYKYQRERLTRIQRKTLLALTGAYRTTSNHKLHEIMGVLDLNAEFEFARESAGIDKATRRDQYVQRLEDGGERHHEIEETKSKVMIWYLTGHGPFRIYLNRFGLSQETSCRLCGSHQDESPEHLVRECDETSTLRPLDENDVLEVESMLKSITRMIYRAERAIKASEERLSV